MIDLPMISPGLTRSVVQNFTIIATLILLYNFIPNAIPSRSKLAYPLGVGIVFGIAAALSIPALWEGETASVLGFNIILIPLAGFIAGPVSAAIVALVLILGDRLAGGSLSVFDAMTLMNGILLGALFYKGITWEWFPRAYRTRILLLGAGVAGILLISSVLSLTIQGAHAPGSPIEVIISLIPFFIIVFSGTVVLGEIIGFIDRKKQAELEILAYRDHLERQVEMRTAELKKANALQKATIESTADGIVVVDRDGIIRACNQKACHMLGLPPEIPKLGAGVFLERTAAMLKNPEEFLDRAGSLSDSAEQIVMDSLEFGSGRICEVFVHPQQIDDQILGRVWNFHDITDKTQADNAIRSAYNKLSILSNITRHDIFNQLTAIGAYLELVMTENRDPAARDHLESMKKSLDVIRFQLEFTRDYQDLGLKKPGWQNVCNAFLQAVESYDRKNITFVCDTGDLEIYADPMISQVFYNLIDNTLRHNEKISSIRVSQRTDAGNLVVLYEDDGVGVPPEEKEKIFQRGFGKHTGLGMFLIKEILTITGISIRETGTFGSGVRFEIRVPADGFRFPACS